MTSRQPMSLSLRMMICVTLAIILCLLLMRAIVERSIDFHFIEQDANDLQAVATAIEQVALRYEDNADQLRTALKQSVPLPHGMSYAVSELQGRVLYAAPDAAARLLASELVPTDKIEPRQLASWEEGGRSYRGASLHSRVGSRELVISLAMDLSFHDHFMSELRGTLWAVTLGAGLLTLAVVWIALSQGLAPVRRLSASIRGIRSDRLQTRLNPATVPRELMELVNSFNQMLGQLDESYSRLSNFSADIAHELRTPLTNVITQTQVALGSERSAGEYRELLHSNLEELERLARMVSDMLWLAQADRGLITPAFETLDLAAEAHALLEYFGVLAEEKQVEFTLEGSTQHIRGDRSMVRRALANLLSNAIRHTPEAGSVTIRLGQDQDRVGVSVENTGPGIPSEHLSRIFDRFYEVDPSRSQRGEGSGLGLAIVRSIVTIHGGDVRARSGNGVTAFTLDFPTLSAPGARV